jgi:uncharacterized membrane protein YhaH (DUF805 family)
MQNIDLDESDAKSVRISTYHVPKKLFWPVILVFTAIFIVLLVLTIYFGVNRNSLNGAENGLTRISTTTISLPATTTISPSPPVQRIPDNLQQLFYQLTITPNLTDETFTGKEMEDF